jgi:GTP-binding protein Era
MSTHCGFVAIIGKPNAGKSTLLNSLIGSKLSIITPKPQTTRKRVIGIYSVDDTQIVFIDTPGILKPRYEMQRIMMNYVHESVNESDLLLYLIDIKDLMDSDFPGYAIDLLKSFTNPKIIILNKVDLIKDKKQILPVMDKIIKLGIFTEVIPLSALENDNTDILVNLIKKHIPEAPFYYDPELLSTQPQRFFVAELIRENIFNLFKDEIPYSTEVQIVEFKERSAGKWFISAEIFVERDSQKRIIIGAGGSKIKEIGEKSRMEIENHLELEVYLELFVKVRANWRDDKSRLSSMGY